MTNKHLTTAVPRRNYPAIFAGSRQSVEHTVCGGRNLGNRLFAIALLAQVSCHHADHVGAGFGEYDTRSVAYALEFPPLFGGRYSLPQITRNVTWPWWSGYF